MASVPGIYARALADVVFDQRLDPSKTLQQAQSLVELVASSRVLREVWETPSIPAEQKRGVLDAIAVREWNLASGSELYGRAHRSSASSVPGTDREGIRT